MQDSELPCRFPQCGAQFQTQAELDDHLQSTHIDLRGLKCRECHKSFASRQNLHNHVFTHTGERPYVCLEPNCGKTFRQGSQLSSHKQSHFRSRKQEASASVKPLKVRSM